MIQTQSTIIQEKLEKLLDAFTPILYEDDEIFLAGMKDRNLAGDDIRRYQHWEWTQGVGLYGLWKIFVRTKEQKYLDILTRFFDAQTEIGFDITYIRPYCAHENCTEIIDYPATVFEAGLKHKRCNDCGLDLAGQVIKQLVPTTPVINYLSNGVDGIKVSWNLVDGASAYYLYRRAGGSSKWVGPFKVKGNSYEDTTVESGVYYKYAVRAVNSAGLSPYNGGKVIKRVDTPEYLSVSNTEGGIYFKWNSVKNATSYRVYRKLAEDSSWTYITTVKKTYYADLDVASGTDYVYTVRAVSNNVYSNFLPGVKIRRLDLPKLNGTKSTAEGVYIDFEPVEGATGYNIYRKTGNGPWTSQSYLGAIKTTRSHTYLDVSAKKGVTYTYTVKAYYKDGSTTSVSAYTVNGTSCKDVY